ncbi:MAG TPA: hypothetical protein VF501_06250, partial [Thiobacillus sp.]
MTFRNHLNLHATLLACCLATAFSAAHAAEIRTTTRSTTTSAAVGTSITAEAKLSAEFAGFLGGETQAGAVVSGLRQGTAFSFNDGTGTSTPIAPPTGTMGYGNVRIALRLAQAELSKLGITQPTAGELSAVLLGGTIDGTRVNGILAMRADGMGWGQIAKTYGMTVGQIMGKGAGLTQQATTPPPPIRMTTKASASRVHSNGYIPSGTSNTHAAGIVSATGASVGSSGNGGGKGQANKLVTGSQPAVPAANKTRATADRPGRQWKRNVV